MGLTGAVLVVFDNFLFGEQLNLKNIPSYFGNVLLICASVWAAKDNSKQRVPLFGKGRR